MRAGSDILTSQFELALLADRGAAEQVVHGRAGPHPGRSIFELNMKRALRVGRPPFGHVVEATEQ